MDDLFAPVRPDEAQSEHIDAPEYSYWGSVFRVFFQKKINIFLLILLALLLAFTYVYPAVTGYDPAVDPYVNLLDPTAKHLGPRAAVEKFGFSLRWILGRFAKNSTASSAVISST